MSATCAAGISRAPTRQEARGRARSGPTPSAASQAGRRRAIVARSWRTGRKATTRMTCARHGRRRHRDVAAMAADHDRDRERRAPSAATGRRRRRLPSPGPPSITPTPASATRHRHGGAPLIGSPSAQPGEQGREHGRHRLDEEDVRDARVVERDDERRPTRSRRRPRSRCRRGRPSERLRPRGRARRPRRRPSSATPANDGAAEDLRRRVERELALQHARGRPRERGERDVDLAAAVLRACSSRRSAVAVAMRSQSTRRGRRARGSACAGRSSRRRSAPPRAGAPRGRARPGTRAAASSAVVPSARRNASMAGFASSMPRAAESARLALAAERVVGGDVRGRDADEAKHDRGDHGRCGRGRPRSGTRRRPAPRGRSRRRRRPCSPGSGRGGGGSRAACRRPARRSSGPRSARSSMRSSGDAHGRDRGGARRRVAVALVVVAQVDHGAHAVRLERAPARRGQAVEGVGAHERAAPDRAPAGAAGRPPRSRTLKQPSQARRRPATASAARVTRAQAPLPEPRRS